jgi:pimeloyl-ACP methyl ester carboxylesterase
MIAWDESGSGAPIVFVHGLTEDRRGWDPVIAHLTDRFRCVRLDLRGHGQSSDAADLSALAMAADIAEVVAEAQIAQAPLVVGHSLGAVVATVYAAQAPTRGVVNIDQSMRFGEFAAALAPLAPRLRDPATFHETYQLAFGELPASLDPRYRTYLDQLHDDARQSVVLGVWGLVLDSSPDELTAMADTMLAAITVPYHAIHGSDPGPGYADWLTERVPGPVTVEVWDGDGHYPHLVEPGRLAARLSEISGQSDS